MIRTCMHAQILKARVFHAKVCGTMETSADMRCGHGEYENSVWIERVSSRSGLTPLHFALAVKCESGISSTLALMFFSHLS